MENNYVKTAMRVSFVTIVINVILSGFKLAAGIIANSAAMISDSVHSMSDVLSTIVVIIGVRISAKESDEDHPYGHERMECVAAIILAAVLFATGLGIGYSGVKTVLWNTESLKIPGTLALIAAAISIIVKEGMYWYTRIAAKKIDSGALMADAWHHRSDALSSIGSFAGILGARLGYPVLDPVASLIICIFILKAAYGIFQDSIGKMTDKSCDEKTEGELKSLVLEQKGVLGIDQMRTRIFGNKIYVDIEIQADCNLSLQEAHKIAEQVHEMIEDQFPRVKHCMVHVNPAE